MNNVQILNFGAKWCGPCRMFKPMLEKFADKHGIPLSKVDITDQPEDAAAYGVTSVPTTLFVNEGVVTATFVGVASEAKLEALLAEASVKHASA